MPQGERVARRKRIPLILLLAAAVLAAVGGVLIALDRQITHNEPIVYIEYRAGLAEDTPVEVTLTACQGVAETIVTTPVLPGARPTESASPLTLQYAYALCTDARGETVVLKVRGSSLSWKKPGDELRRLLAPLEEGQSVVLRGETETARFFGEVPVSEAVSEQTLAEIFAQRGQTLVCVSPNGAPETKTVVDREIRTEEPGRALLAIALTLALCVCAKLYSDHQRAVEEERRPVREIVQSLQSTQVASPFERRQSAPSGPPKNIPVLAPELTLEALNLIRERSDREQGPFITTYFRLPYPIGWETILSFVVTLLSAPAGVRGLTIGDLGGPERSCDDALHAGEDAIRQIPEASWLMLEGDNVILSAPFRMRLSNQTDAMMLQTLGIPSELEYRAFVGALLFAVFGTREEKPSCDFATGLRLLEQHIRRTAGNSDTPPSP